MKTIYRPQPKESGRIDIESIDLDENGRQVGKNRTFVTPGDDISEYPQYVQDICNRWWQDFTGEEPTEEELKKRGAKRKEKEKRQKALDRLIEKEIKEIEKE